MGKTFTLASIIVNYKSEERTITYVKEELQPKCRIPQLIIIVNNEATEESSKKLSESLQAPIVRDIVASSTDSDIYIIHNPKNSGFAKGNNLGVDFISKHFEVEYLLFSNNDIRIIDSNVIEVLIEKLKSLPDVGVIGPKVIGLDGKNQNPYIYTPFWNEILWMSWGRYLPHWNFKEFDREKASEGYYYRLMGSFFVIPLHDYLQCGGMDPHTFLYAEEIILAERMLNIGKKNYYVPSVKILHEHGQTTSKYLNKGNEILLESILYYFKTYKHISNIKIILGKRLVQLYCFLQRIYQKI
jgi:GT2 family glycosyltransferase